MIPIAKPAFAPLDMPPPLDEESDPAVEAGLAELEVASMKDEVDDVDSEEEERDGEEEEEEEEEEVC